MSANVVVLRHVAFEDLGSLAPALTALGLGVRYLEMGLDSLDNVDPLAPALVVVLGGPIGVYEQDAYPFLYDEIAWLAARLAARLPTLGLCLGSQLMAAALGARVYPGGEGKEIGWGALTLTADARQYPFAEWLVPPVLHWHGDTFDLPAGATLLAGTPRYPHQVYALDQYGLAFQCHPEVTLKGLERWYIGHACEIAGVGGLDVVSLREAGRQHAPTLEAVADKLWPAVFEWLGLGRS